jgi:D-glycero-D-manno-heptose 1,7-bisphosphate phosphatase
MNQFPRAVAQPQPRLRVCRTVFLDRDGTLNVKPPDGEYVTSPAELSLIPGAAAAISRLNAAAIRVILVTNQRWLSGPKSDWTGYVRVHARLEELLAADGAHLDAAYFCPHSCGSCACRKPDPGMLQRAAGEYRFSLAAAVMVGDSGPDVAAGRAAGTATILLRSGQQITSGDADLVVENLAEAVSLILGDGCSSAYGLSHRLTKG